MKLTTKDVANVNPEFRMMNNRVAYNMELDKIYNCDCLDFLQSMSDKCVDLVVTDPPYYLPSWEGGGFINEKTVRKEWREEIDVDNLSRSYDIDSYADLLYKVQDGKINAYFFCNKLQIPQYFKTYVERYKCKFDILSWHKDNAMPTFKGKYLTDTEYVLYFRNKGGCNPQCYEDAKTYWIKSINIKDKKKYGHPTIKPLDIVRTLVRNSSSEGDLVFDGFLGSGTTAIACIKEKRHFIGCELNKEYFDKAQKRIKAEQAQLTLF